MLELRQIDLLSGLSQPTLSQLEQAVILRAFAPEEIIQIGSDPCDRVCFIAEGEVGIFRLSSDGREQVLVRLREGQGFNTVPPLQPDSLNQASARTYTNTHLYVLSKADYLHFLKTFPDFSFAILQDFAGRLSHLTNLVENLSLHSVRGRLARFLLEQADNDQLTRRWTQDEIAAHLGTVRDMVGRALREFMDAGYISKDRNQLILLDREGLVFESES